MVGAAFTYVFILDPAPEKVFASTFGQPVPANVQNLKCHTLWIGDCWVLWLRFETDESEFKKLVPTEFTRSRSGYSSFTDTSSGPNAPDWWKPNVESETTLYSLQRFPGKSFRSETFSMTYNRDTRYAYYYFCGSD